MCSFLKLVSFRYSSSVDLLRLEICFIHELIPEKIICLSVDITIFVILYIYVKTTLLTLRLRLLGNKASGSPSVDESLVEYSLHSL